MNPSVTEEEVDGFIENLKTMIESLKGELRKIDKWGKRQLAYEVSKVTQGYYVLLWVTGSPAIITELERRYKITDNVIRFMTVVLPESELDKKVIRPRTFHRSEYIPSRRDDGDFNEYGAEDQEDDGGEETGDKYQGRDE